MKLRALAVLVLSGSVGWAQSPAPGPSARPSPSPAPVPSASPRAEEVPESYRKVLATLRERKEEDVPAAELRLGRPAAAAAEAPAAAKTPKAGPLPVIRALRQIEGEWVVFFECERKPAYSGDTVKGAKVLSIAEDGVIVEVGGERRKIAAKVVKQPFPELAFNGVIDMPGGRVVMMRGRRDPVKAGDLINGARVIEIQKDRIVVEFEGERRALPAR